jgi:DNA helicase MCM8
MRSEHAALLEAMEQQSISIAKAGMVCTLPSRCVLICAANPVGGHYNRAKTVSENLKISSALLSRFDLVFILLDKPDEKRDLLLSEHVMKLHEGIERKKDPTQRAPTQSGTHKPLKDMLKPNKNFEGLPTSVLRKYIAYARKFVHPKLSPEACDILQQFYLGLRKVQHSSDSIPITTRQLESLIRLSQARAKLELRDLVTEQDALDVVEIMKDSLYDILTDEMGQIDFRRNNAFASVKGKETNRFLSELNLISSKKGVSTFSMNEMYDIAKTIQLKMANGFDRMIEQCNHEGYLLKQNGGLWKLAISSTAY